MQKAGFSSLPYDSIEQILSYLISFDDNGVNLKNIINVALVDKFLLESVIHFRKDREQKIEDYKLLRDQVFKPIGKGCNAYDAQAEKEEYLNEENRKVVRNRVILAGVVLLSIGMCGSFAYWLGISPRENLPVLAGIVTSALIIFLVVTNRNKFKDCQFKRYDIDQHESELSRKAKEIIINVAQQTRLEDVIEKGLLTEINESENNIKLGSSVRKLRAELKKIKEELQEEVKQPVKAEQLTKIASVFRNLPSQSDDQASELEIIVE